MSLILDALRKSEAERRRGQSPDLFSTSNIAVPASQPGMRWFPVAVFVLLLLASAWVIWDGRSKRPLDDVASVSDLAAVDPAASADGVEDYPDAVAAAPKRADGIATPAVAASPAPPPDISPTASASTVTASVPASRPAPGNGFATAPMRPTAAVAPAFTNPPFQALPAPPLEPPAAEPPAEEALPSLAVLDSITRGSLPPLKLSMHVWGQEPGKRFAIVDGQRVAEGSLLGNGVVEKIRRDGVVINVNGQRLLLPKP